jgi:transcriptional regulator with XRE-family HTH domain
MDLALLLGKKIRSLRKAAGISQDRLALASGLDSSYVGRIERGEVNVTIMSLYQIAIALNYPARDLLPANEACSFEK